MGEFKAGKAMFAHLTPEEKTSIAMEQVKRKVEKEGALVNQYLDDRKQRYADNTIPDSAPHSLQSCHENAETDPK